MPGKLSSHLKKTGGIAAVCLIAHSPTAFSAGARDAAAGPKADPLHLRSTAEAVLSRSCPEAEKENLIWVSGFEEGCFRFVLGGRATDTQGPLWAQAQFQGPYAAEFVGKPVRSGTSALRLEWRKDAMRKDSNTSRKAMIHFGRTPTPESTDRWYGFSLFIPSKDFPADSGPYRVVLFQIHATPDMGLGEPYRKPLLMLSVDRGVLHLLTSHDLEKVSPGNKNIDANRTNRIICPLSDLWDHWSDFVVHARLSLKGEGVAQVWKDGRLVADLHGINLGYNDAAGPYPSWGIYSYGSDFARRVLFLDEVRIGDKDAGYRGVAPGKMDGSARPEIEPAPTGEKP